MVRLSVQMPPVSKNYPGGIFFIHKIIKSRRSKKPSLVLNGITTAENGIIPD
ncbi:MAG: hypothetical protein AB9834_07530 [Lentimicrobium sp.]